MGGPFATAYSIYAVPAARIIHDPMTGSIIVLLVAVGMIGHSLLYRSQAVTAVAYFAAFAALAVTPLSPFAVIGLIPTAASILYLSARFDWYSMSVFGLVATYATCISRGDSNAPLAPTQTLFSHIGCCLKASICCECSSAGQTAAWSGSFL